MNNHDATEAAYRNGYADGFAAARISAPPCKIGDTVFGLRRMGERRLLKCGKVSAMFYNEDMELVIVASHVCRGLWGQHVFGTQAEAEEALRRHERRMG